MVDFKNNTSIFKMDEGRRDTFDKTITQFYVRGEETVACYKAFRDYMIFTTRRIIIVNVQGLSGKKRDYSSIPYSKIQAFSVRTAGMLDIDTDVDLAIAGIGLIHLEFTAGTNVGKLLRIIGEYTL